MLQQKPKKRIDEIEVGELVWSANVETGEIELKEVTEVFVKEDNVLVHLTIGADVINTTSLHPFYVIDKGWTEAVEIEVGDRVLLQNGTSETLSEKTVEQLEIPVKVYNFTVDDFDYLDYPKSERVGRQNGNTPRNNVSQNKQASDALVEENITRDNPNYHKIRRKVHDIITKEGEGYHDISSIVKKIKNELK